MSVVLCPALPLLPPLPLPIPPPFTTPFADASSLSVQNLPFFTSRHLCIATPSLTALRYPHSHPRRFFLDLLPTSHRPSDLPWRPKCAKYRIHSRRQLCPRQQVSWDLARRVFARTPGFVALEAWHLWLVTSPVATTPSPYFKLQTTQNDSRYASSGRHDSIPASLSDKVCTALHTMTVVSNGLFLLVFACTRPLVLGCRPLCGPPRGRRLSPQSRPEKRLQERQGRTYLHLEGPCEPWVLVHPLHGDAYALVRRPRFYFCL